MKFNKAQHGKLLMYYRIICRVICEKHEIKQSDLDTLIYLYGVGLFTRKQIRTFTDAGPFDMNRMNRLLNEGWLIKFPHRYDKQTMVYTLSRKANGVITSLYRKVFGEEDISMHYKQLDSYKKRSKHMKAVNSGLIKQINEESRQQRHALELSCTPDLSDEPDDLLPGHSTPHPLP